MTKNPTEQDFVREIQFFIEFCKSKTTVEYLKVQAKMPTSKELDSLATQKDIVTSISQEILALGAIILQCPLYIPLNQHTFVSNAVKTAFSSLQKLMASGTTGEMGEKTRDYLEKLYDLLLWRLARGALHDGAYVYALRLANHLIAGCGSRDSSSTPSSYAQSKRGMYESLGWRLRAVAASGVGDFAQASYSCNQIAKYNDIDDDDVIEAAGFVEDAMQSLQSRRQSSSLQSQVLYEISRVVTKIVSLWARPTSGADDGSTTIRDEPLYETLLRVVKEEHPFVTLRDTDAQPPVATIEDLLREFDSANKGKSLLNEALPPLFSLLHQALHFMQQNLFHSALCGLVACASVCGALQSVLPLELIIDDHDGVLLQTLHGILLLSLTNASTCAARLHAVWTLATATLTSSLFAEEPSLNFTASNLNDSPSVVTTSTQRLFKSKKEVKSSDIDGAGSVSSSESDETAETDILQFRHILTAANLTSCFPNSPEYLSDLAISLIGYYSVAKSSFPIFSASHLVLDEAVLRWREIEIFVILKRHEEALQLLESFMGRMESKRGFVDWDESQFSCTFDLAGKRASDLWNSCMELNYTLLNANEEFRRFQMPDFTISDQGSVGIKSSMTSFRRLMESFQPEAEKEKTRALNRLKRFGSKG